MWFVPWERYKPNYSHFPKVNAIARLEFELANYDVADYNVNYYAL